MEHPGLQTAALAGRKAAGLLPEAPEADAGEGPRPVQIHLPVPVRPFRAFSRAHLSERLLRETTKA